MPGTPVLEIEPILRDALVAILGEKRMLVAVGDDDLVRAVDQAAMQAFREQRNDVHAAVIRAALVLADKGRLTLDSIDGALKQSETPLAGCTYPEAELERVADLVTNNACPLNPDETPAQYARRYAVEALYKFIIGRGGRVDPRGEG